MKTTLQATAVPGSTYRSKQMPLMSQAPATPSLAARTFVRPLARTAAASRQFVKPDPVVRLLAYFMFVRGAFGLALAAFLATAGPGGLVVAGIATLLSLPSVVLAIGLAKLKAWARNAVVALDLLSLALAIVPSTSGLVSSTMVGMLFSLVVIAWLVYRWDRFR